MHYKGTYRTLLAETEVQEYRLYHGVCGHCRKTNKSVLPAGVPRGQLEAMQAHFAGSAAPSLMPSG